MSWYLAALKKYAVFSGRARRKEYWFFVLFNVIIAFVLGLIDGFLGFTTEYGIGILGGLYALAVFIPGLAVTVRRLHDTNRSGWMLLLGLIPFIGFIILLVFYFQDSDSVANKYGENPKLKADPAM